MKNYKFTTLSIVGLLAFSSMNAQLTVDTSPQKKNVVLEEYTGIYCGYCPDGHKIANQVKQANPNDVVLINVHTGSFANPNGSDPDFRTPFGSALAGQTGLTGYPAGTVNRHVFSGSNTALSRSAWQASATTILGQDSYVNMAIEGSVNVQTRVLTVNVKAYYTGNGANNNKINVALLQSKVEGPQSGSAGNPSQVLPNGNYEHNHMLRHLITGQWGEAIDTTTQGTTVTKTYTYTIPADLNGVAYEIGNLEVAAFITEGQQEIITGVDADVTLDVPAGVSIIDFESTDATDAAVGYCNTSATPKLTVKNAGNNVISSFKASYSLNDGTKVYENVSTPLAVGASTTVSFPVVNLTDMVNRFEFGVEGTSSSEIEVTFGNNSARTGLFLNLGSLGVKHTESFEDASNAGDLEKCALTSTGLSVYVLKQGDLQNWNTKLGAYEQSEKAMMFHNYAAPKGSKVYVTYEKVDFSAGVDHGFVFDHAYAQYDDSSNDELSVRISEDCGANWTNVLTLKGASAATGPLSSNGLFAPKSAHWRKNIIDLTSYSGKSDLMIQIVGTSDYGNNFWVDNVTFGEDAPISVNENNVIDYTVFPNPATDFVNLKGENLQGETFKIFDVTGKLIKQNTLNNDLRIDVSELAAGVYSLQVKGQSSRLIVQ
ncbi:MAG: Omp28-related outer membrane protein [Flavobacteriales bacterium]|jgi:thiol-disulfide isomerase/thioredoxin|nr:Omp28-related outer membrane protein [Flavobacteriales bacterium]